MLPSNGRLESDLLERLEAELAVHPSANGPARQQLLSSTEPDNASTKVSADNGISPPTNTSSPFATPRSISPAVPSRAETLAGNSPKDLMDRHIQQLTLEEQSLQEVLRNQAHPDNLAAVKAPRTPVLSRPLGSSAVLFLADAEDEFQVLGTQGEWVHVQISGLSRGWIRAAQVDLPGDRCRLIQITKLGPIQSANRFGRPAKRLAYSQATGTLCAASKSESSGFNQTVVPTLRLPGVTK